MVDIFNDGAGETEPVVIRSEKRKPGRPPKEKPELKNGETVKPDEATEKPKRRKRGGKPEDIEDRAKNLFGIHQMIAGIMKLPEMEISPQEAMQLAKASIALEKELDIEINTKAMAIGSMIATCGLIYFPRVKAINTRVKGVKAKRAGGVTVEGEAETIVN